MGETMAAKQGIFTKMHFIFSRPEKTHHKDWMDTHASVIKPVLCSRSKTT